MNESTDNYTADLNFLLEYGLTPEAFSAMKTAARFIVDSGDREEVLRVLFNQVNNFCKDAGVDTDQVFRDVVDHVNSRLEY